jgi:hypothetical protein
VTRDQSLATLHHTLKFLYFPQISAEEMTGM